MYNALWLVLQRRGTWYLEKVQPRLKGGVGFQAWEAHLPSPGLGGHGKGNRLESFSEGKMVEHSPHARYMLGTFDTSSSSLHNNPMRQVLFPGPSSISWDQRTIFPGNMWSQKWQARWSWSQKHNQLMGAEIKLASSLSRERSHKENRDASWPRTPLWNMKKESNQYKLKTKARFTK